MSYRVPQGLGAATLLFVGGLAFFWTRSRGVVAGEGSRAAAVAFASSVRETGGEPVAVSTPRASAAPPSDYQQGAAAVAVFAGLVDRLQSSLEASKSYERYLECANAGKPGCEKLWDRAVYPALEVELEPGHVASLVTDASNGGEAAFARVAAEAVRSPDPLQRMTALSVLSATPKLKKTEIDRRAYEDLKHKSVPEVNLLLYRHDQTSLPESAVEGVAALAADASVDPRSRRAAAAALANARDASEFVRVVDGMLAGETSERNTILTDARLIYGFEHCGAICRAAAERMSNDARPWVRNFATEVLQDH